MDLNPNYIAPEHEPLKYTLDCSSYMFIKEVESAFTGEVNDSVKIIKRMK